MSTETALKGLELISQTVGDCPDLVQGGGGNTSAKLNDEVMAVKASGYKLNQVNRDEGYVKVNYRKILDYYQNVDLREDKDFEKESVEMVRNSVIPDQSKKSLKPSIEAGFHSVLKKYVIHTHSVYANILCCIEKGEELVGKVFEDEEYWPVWIPYTHPGFYLTLAVQETVSEYNAKYGQIPPVIFMENHGLIVTADDPEECISINTAVSDKIKAYFDIKEAYPRIEVEKVADSVYKSATRYLKEFFQNSNITNEYFERILYPDQIVYLGDNISINGEESKINIDTNQGEIIYKTNYNEALTIEETLTAYLYIIENIEKNNLQLKTMSPKYIKMIQDMEGEKYRKKIMKDMK
ncbi:MAG: hypothetical protein PWR10_1292 [Halanaerobiales bacterium]|nr:hypothetical protein [Halanaerobiales bacterium]